MKPISYLAGLAEANSLSQGKEIGSQIQLIADAGAAILLLLSITTISVYKPWGKIQWKSNVPAGQDKIGKKSWKLYAIVGLISFILFIILKHLFGGGMSGH